MLLTRPTEKEAESRENGQTVLVAQLDDLCLCCNLDLSCISFEFFLYFSWIPPGFLWAAC